MKKRLLTLAALTAFLNAGGDISPFNAPGYCGGLYTKSYMPYAGVEHPCIDTGIHNPFPGEKLLNKRVHFHASLYFKEGKLTDESLKALSELDNIIRDRHLRNYYVSIIGHSAGYEDGNHMVDLNAWSTFWQNLGSKNMTRTEFATLVNQRIKAVYDHLVDVEGISPGRLYTENRLARDPVSTEATKEGRERNERVDVALYY